MSQQARIEVRQYFATPVIVAQLPEAEAINRELRGVIIAKMAEDGGVRHSNLGGWQSSWDFERWSGEAGRRVLDFARALAVRMTADRAGKPVRVAWKMNAWANVNRRGHGNEFHTHPGSFWSGTYTAERMN